jgi:magnesium transporter
MPIDGLTQLAERTAAEEPQSGVINCAAYAEGRRVATLRIEDMPAVLASRDEFVWLGLLEPSEELLQQVQRQLHLHDLAIEDAHSAHQRPKLEQYKDCLFVVLRTVQRPSPTADLEFGETHVFVGRNYLVTVRHGSMRSHIGLRTRLEAAPALLAKGPGFVLYALMDFIVDQYFPVVEGLEEKFEDLEEQIFGEHCSRETTRGIYHLRRDLVALKRTILPLVDVCNRLMKFDVEMVPADTHPYFRDIHDHLLRLNEMIDSLRELLGTALEANASLISEQHTVQTKRLAAWAAIIAVPTMVAGIYGMNFQDMPELRWSFGYPVTLGLMVTACVGLYVGFRRSGWL